MLAKSIDNGKSVIIKKKLKATLKSKKKKEQSDILSWDRYNVSGCNEFAWPNKTRSKGYSFFSTTNNYLSPKPYFDKGNIIWV